METATAVMAELLASGYIKKIDPKLYIQPI